MSQEPGFNLSREKLKGDLVMVWKMFSRWLSDTKGEGKKTQETGAPFIWSPRPPWSCKHVTLDGAADLEADVTDHVGTKPRLFKSENNAINMTFDNSGQFYGKTNLMAHKAGNYETFLVNPDIFHFIESLIKVTVGQSILL